MATNLVEVDMVDEGVEGEGVMGEAVEVLLHTKLPLPPRLLLPPVPQLLQLVDLVLPLVGTALRFN